MLHAVTSFDTLPGSGVDAMQFPTRNFSNLMESEQWKACGWNKIPTSCEILQKSLVLPQRLSQSVCEDLASQMVPTQIRMMPTLYYQKVFRRAVPDGLVVAGVETP